MEQGWRKTIQQKKKKNFCIIAKTQTTNMPGNEQQGN